jgi:hypothetical protein
MNTSVPSFQCEAAATAIHALKRKEPSCAELQQCNAAAASILVDLGGLALRRSAYSGNLCKNTTASSMTRFWVDVGRGSKAAVAEKMPACGDDGAFQRGSGRRRHEHGSTPRSGAEVYSRLCGLVEPNRVAKNAGLTRSTSSTGVRRWRRRRRLVVLGRARGRAER